MANVTYYLGAGASAGRRNDRGWILEGLPVVNEITNRIMDYINNIKNAKFPDNISAWKNPQFGLTSLAAWENGRQRLLSYLNLLYDACRRNATIDTYAKKLVLQDKQAELEQLERMLSFYFILEQVILPPDSRYDTFLANILQDRRQFPQNIKVLSWNYDSQFEIAYYEYDKEFQLKIGSKMASRYEAFDILKLNGSASFRSTESIPQYRNTLLSKIQKNEEKYDPFREVKLFDILLPDIVFLFKLFVGEINPLRENNTNLSFAFDYNRPSDVLYQRSDEIIRSTDVLVIIGYTFPFFNRVIDRRILAPLNPHATIYIQDPHPERIQQSLQAVCPDMLDAQIHLRNDVDQFFLPPEL